MIRRNPFIKLIKTYSLKQWKKDIAQTSEIFAEITTTNINHDDTITVIKIPNHVKPIKLSQYADDSTLPPKEQKSAEKVMSLFQKLNKASGATINFEKTKILPINTDQITLLQERLPHTTIKEQYEVHVGNTNED